MSRKEVLIVVAVLVVAGAIAAALLASASSAGDPSCANYFVASALAPDSSNLAVVFDRDCGATTQSSTHVSIVSPRDPLPSGGGNVLVVEGPGARPVRPAGGSVRVWLTWARPDSLVVQYQPDAHVIMSRSRLRAVAVALSPHVAHN